MTLEELRLKRASVCPASRSFPSRGRRPGTSGRVSTGSALTLQELCGVVGSLVLEYGAYPIVIESNLKTGGRYNDVGV